MNYALLSMNWHARQHDILQETNDLPGIRDTQYGLLLVAPGDWVNKRAQQDGNSPRNLAADTAAKYIREYYATTS